MTLRRGPCSFIWKVAVLVILLPIFLAAGWVLTSSPTDRCRSFARVAKECREHWPLPRGGSIPTRIGLVLNAAGIVRPVRVEIEPRISMLLDPVDLVDQSLLVTGYWEKEVWDWITPHLPAAGSFVDVGAHIGTFTLRAAKQVGEQGRVIAVEPNPITAARLRDNIAASQWANIHVSQVACAETPGKLPLFGAGRLNSGAASLSRENVLSNGGDGRVSFEVDVLPLDQVLEPLALSRLDVIKVDTEGAEVQVLKGARNTIRKHRPVLVLETMDEQLRHMNSSLAELEALLRELGYTRGRYSVINAEWLPRSQ